MMAEGPTISSWRDSNIKGLVTIACRPCETLLRVYRNWAGVNNDAVGTYGNMLILRVEFQARPLITLSSK